MKKAVFIIVLLDFIIVGCGQKNSKPDSEGELKSALVNVASGDTIRNQTDIRLIVIRAGRLIDTENSKTLLNQIILIEGDTIRDIGENISIPENAVVYDLSGYTVLPGLIDCHTHLTFQLGEGYYDDLFRKSITDNAIMAPSYARKTLEAGFTSCRDVGSVGFIDVSLRNAINKGDIPGPRLQAAGAALSCTGGHGDLTGFSPWLSYSLPPEMTGIADGIEGVRKAVRYNIKFGADVIKMLASGGVLEEGASVSAPRYSQEEMNSIVNEAAMWGKKVCAHAMGPSSIKMAILADVASIEHGCIMDDECFSMMRKRGTFLVSDLYVDEYILSEYRKNGYPAITIEKERQVGLAQRKVFQKAVAAGVKIAFGTDAGIYPHGWNARQFSYMVKWGMTPLQAIRSATVNAANLMGMQNTAGSVTTGKLADIIATEVSPLDDISSLEDVKFVMKGGLVFKNNTGKNFSELNQTAAKSNQ